MTQGTSLTELETSILMTLTYADTLDRPLTLAELHRGLFTPRPVTLEEVADALDESPVLPSLAKREGDYWFLEGRRHVVAERILRDTTDLRSAAGRAFFASLLAAMPCVDSLYACDNDSLVVVARPGFTWTAHWSVRLAEGVARYRLRCVVLERDHQELPVKDAFTARLVATARCLYPSRDLGALKAANPWVRDFCANAWDGTEPAAAAPASFLERLAAGFALPFERILEGLAGLRPRRAVDTSYVFDSAWRRQHAKASAMAELVEAWKRP